MPPSLDRSYVVNHYAHLRHNVPYETNMVLPVPDGTRGAKPAAETNVPERFELFLLGEGEKKVTEEIDTRESRASGFHRHGIGNNKYEVMV